MSTVTITTVPGALADSRLNAIRYAEALKLANGEARRLVQTLTGVIVANSIEHAEFIRSDIRFGTRVPSQPSRKDVAREVVTAAPAPVAASFKCAHCGKTARTTAERNCSKSPNGRHEPEVAPASDALSITKTTKGYNRKYFLTGTVDGETHDGLLVRSSKTADYTHAALTHYSYQSRGETVTGSVLTFHKTRAAAAKGSPDLRRVATSVRVIEIREIPEGVAEIDTKRVRSANAHTQK